MVTNLKYYRRTQGMSRIASHELGSKKSLEESRSDELYVIQVFCLNGATLQVEGVKVILLEHELMMLVLELEEFFCC